MRTLCAVATASFALTLAPASAAAAAPVSSHAMVHTCCTSYEHKERAFSESKALGASFEGIHRQHMLVRGGENRDSAWYSILDDEWPAVRERLLVRLGRR